jgi:putative hydrolase of the HAD superfamily
LIQIDTVVFDFGGVISLQPDRGRFGEMAQLCGLENGVFEGRYRDNRTEYDRGTLDGSGFWSAVIDTEESRVDPDLVRKLVRLDCELWTQENPDIVALIKRLIAEPRVRLGILSNMPSTYPDYIWNKCDWIKEIDFLLYSCAVKMVKPQPEIYKLCLEGLGSNPARTLYIDDVEHNVEGGRKAGLNAVRYEIFPALMEQLSDGFDVPGMTAL